MSQRSALFRMSRPFHTARAQAIDRGMGFLERLAGRQAGLEMFGSGLLYCCSFMSATARDPVLRRRARALSLESFRVWQGHRREGIYDGSAESLASAVQCYDAASRLGLRFPRIQQQLRAVARQHAPEDFFWFDPRREAPPANVPETCACGAGNQRGARHCAQCEQPLERVPAMRIWYTCFTSAYCGERFGVPLGVRYAEALQWLPQMRRYCGPRHGVVPFHDSVYAITHIVYTLNDYGRLLLSPHWLPQEYNFLAQHWMTPIENNDPDMAGEFIDSLRAFGLTTAEPAIRYAMEYLIESQNPDGSWGAREGHIDYRRFHATWAALDGLRDFNWTQQGLSFPRLLPRLLRWASQS